MKLYPDKIEMLLVGLSLFLASGCSLLLDGIVLSSTASICRLEMLLDLGLLLDGQVPAVARNCVSSFDNCISSPVRRL